MNYGLKSLKLHKKLKGKITITPKLEINSKEILQLVYTPGVATPCLEISKDVNQSFELTSRANTIAVVTDGTAVLGLGDIGPEAGMPVIEGKCALFKTFGGVNAMPLCIKSKDVDEIVKTIYLLSGSFGGINLEDIAAPRCFEIEKKLTELCDIPIFHDDQHGTAIIVGAACLNAIKLTGKKIGRMKVVINGAGAAGIAITKHLFELGFKDITICNSRGIIHRGMPNLNIAQEEISRLTNKKNIKGTLADAIKKADVFIGVSVGNVVTEEMIKSMKENPIVFPLANPEPEISYPKAKKAGALVVGTGSSLYPNQINNSLVFPGLFRGVLDVHAKTINSKMKIAASKAIAECIPENKLSPENILPDMFNKKVHKAVAKAVMDMAIKTKVSR